MENLLCSSKKRPSSDQSESRYPKQSRVKTSHPGFVSVEEIDLNSQEEKALGFMTDMLKYLIKTSGLTLQELGDVLREVIEMYEGLSDDKPYEDLE